ncbi:Glycosyl transferases group 1 [Pseudobutyrivibrio sp. OR37]|uniref:glycosyltransferase n=1 Tax=Pseudobutyrivibrio sp. OR37 TaxID=1798186 RepID=UPI0008E8455B|nr:glycosyltransferase [Pseudobutyrivibrio sp. OR37]SFI08468.1 Glycosyl transferases group 1 [Pseudobutyrivibrio sp. OR37]
MTKVFFIINCFSKGGGAEALLASILHGLNPNKYELGVMEIIHDTIKQEAIPAYVKVYPYYTLADAPDRKIRMYSVYHEWNKVIEKYIPQDYDIYISFNYLKPSFLLPEGKKNIAWIHGDIYNLLDDNMLEEKQLQDIAFEKVNKIVVISDNTEKSVLDLYPRHKNKIVKLYNCINARKILKESNCKSDIRLDDNSIIFLGRLDENKNPVRAIEIFKEVIQRKADAKLYYIGYGVLKEKVELLAKTYKIEDSVFFLGYQQNPYPIVKQAKVMLMVSKSEGYSLAVSEAICLGVPVVSTRVGAADRQIFCDECGKVIDNNEEAVDAICGYMEREISIDKKKHMYSTEKKEFEEYILAIEHLIDTI